MWWNIIFCLFFVRARKVVPVPSNKSFVSGEDPYLVDCVSDKLFPELRLEQTKGSSSSSGATNSLLHVITLKEGDKCVSLPALSVEQNYSQMLSELVAHIWKKKKKIHQLWSYWYLYFFSCLKLNCDILVITDIWLSRNKLLLKNMVHVVILLLVYLLLSYTFLEL